MLRSLRRRTTPPRRRAAAARGAAALAAVALVAGCGAAGGQSAAGGSGSATTAVPPSVPKTIPSGVTLHIADQLGYLESYLKAGGQDTNFPYKVSYSQFLGGPPMLQAFEAGSLDIGFVADTPLIFAQAAKQPVVGVAAWGTAHSGISLVSAPGVKLSGWAALKGKSVAYQQGTVEEAALLEGLQSVGLKLKDVKTVNLTTTSITPALEKGAVDAGILVEPLTAAYLAKEPKAAEVAQADQPTDKVDFIIADTSALKDPGKEAAIADYIERLEKSVAWINAHPAQWAQALYVTQYKVPLATGEKVVRAAGPVSFSPLPGTIVGAQQNLANLYTAAGEIPSKLNVADEFDSRFNFTIQETK